MEAVGCCVMAVNSENFIRIYSLRLTDDNTDAAKVAQTATFSQVVN